MNVVTKFEFKENEHPREKDGEFTDGSGSISDAISEVREGSGTLTVHHGSNGENTMHIGKTFSPDEATAKRYGSKNYMTGDVDVSGLKIATVRGFDREGNSLNQGAIGDTEEDIAELQKQGIDIIQYHDEDPQGHEHLATRIVSEKALKRFKKDVKPKKDLGKIASYYEDSGRKFAIHEGTEKEVNSVIDNVESDVSTEDFHKALIKAGAVPVKGKFMALLQSPHLTFTRFEALPQSDKPGFYPGVLILETGPAKGHYAVKYNGRVVETFGQPEHAKLDKYPIHITAETLADVVSCGAGNKSTKCKIDHGDKVRDVIGSYASFCLDGDKVRADLSLMKSSPHRPFVEELITDFSEKFGNSIDFVPVYEISGDKAIARCHKLNSVDIVDTPAATSSFFSEPNQPNELKHMPLDKADLDAIRGVVTEQLDTRLATLEKGINTRFTKLEEGGEESEEEKKKKKDKEEEDKKTEMSALVAKTVLSAMQSVLPKAQLTSLTTPAVPAAGGDDTYEGKLALCKSLGMDEGRAIRHIAQKFPALHNAKFGQPAGSAKL